MKTLMQRAKKKFYPCPHCGKKGVYRKDHYLYPGYVEVRCRYCDATAWMPPEDWRGMEDALLVLKEKGKPTRGQFRAPS